ncbi:NAD-dependent epimerase/dehydratase family protein [Belnapia sp. T6]|uniref:NAD-dependent epimerase/dehydratase family protein n=1 Tax=Belnapia mucosa TaxID=2804532 RepID=A0ABS1V2R9_9PROT|nr:NAD-dependent epimerase/dehydratase family protein [Belnapia mucosa]MBL6455572.1 NAD-dependent epimerase/dehydratase family protein [Belnapia mucosa]
MPAEPRRILVTGASGVVGRQVLAPLLARGFAVHAAATRPGPPMPGVTWHAADLLTEADRLALLRAARPETVLHAAWYVAHGRFWTAPENALWEAATLALLAAHRAMGGRRFIGLGTCAEYAATAPGGEAPWPESRPIAPGTPYGTAKARTAEAVLAATAPGYSTAWARLFLLFGPGEPPGRLVPSVFAALLAGRPADCASGRPVRDVASTWFLGEALAALAASPVTGAVNVAAGEGLPLAELVGRIGALVGRPELIRLGALPDRPGEVPVMVADTGRLRRDVGFTTPADLDGDLARLLAMMQVRTPM